MARASTPTMLSIDRFAFNLGIDPLHISGINHGTCGSPVLQYAWQHPGRIGREEIALAIQHAEDLISDELAYYPLPVWREELLPISPRTRHGIALCARGMLVEAGKLAKTLIDDEAEVTYTDEDEDNLDETATITVTTDVTDPEEIAVYYPGTDAAESWEIRPIQVKIDAGTATIVCKTWQMVDVSTTESIDQDEANGLETDALADPVTEGFLEKVEVYRKWTDPAVQGQFEGYASPCRSCGDRGCSSCEPATQSACVSIRDGLIGSIALTPATWDAERERYVGSGWPCRMARPMAARVWHRSGYVDPSTGSKINMARRFERAISILAISLIGTEDLCTCLSTLHDRWSEDLALQESTADGSSTSYKLGKRQESPLGTTRGALEAWNLIREVRNGVSFQ